jgi:protein NrfC
VAIGGILSPFLVLDASGDLHAAYAASQGYLLVDTKKCQGCLSCMLACSLVHDGEANLSTARIQVLQDSFAKWPEDVSIEQCRQCATPACVEACPTGALTADPQRGHVRCIDPAKCIGCTLCLLKCPFVVKRLTVVQDERKLTGIRAAKCDLCADAPYHWSDVGGGPGGEQACVAICPVEAIQYTATMPKQSLQGYNVNLRDANWGKLGYPTD